jgi:hypothetical protein
LINSPRILPPSAISITTTTYLLVKDSQTKTPSTTTKLALTNTPLNIRRKLFVKGKLYDDLTIRI